MGPVATIADRWVLGELLGVGGGGRVWKVTDRVTGGPAALKLLRVTSEVQRRRVEREVHALRVLQVPGVVRLLDVGDHLGEPFLVTEFVPGERFPGPGVGRDWPRLLPRLRDLLTVLVHVHRRGLVHRDLKPDNVLVDAAGRVTVLDFGLARGAELASTVTLPGNPVGTPRYLAPEQLRGDAVDARTDLYALGAMLFECLAGRPPYPDATFTERFLTLRIPPPPRLAEAEPELPAGLCATVDALLALDPADRPASAAHVLARLAALDEAGAPTSPPLTLPLVGRQAELVELVVAAHEGRSLGVRASPGMGRTRLLREVARRLGAEGRTVALCVPGRRPLESVQPVVGVPSSRDGVAELGERLRERVAAGLVVVVDDPARLDTWSAKLLARAAEVGSVLGLGAGAAVELAPLDEGALAQLFAGPSRVLHLPEDAAAILHARTAGVPARVTAQLAAWIGAGLARWDGARLHVDRATLDRLAGGLEVGDAGVWSVGATLTLEEGLADRLSWVVLAASAVSPDLLARAAEAADWQVDAEVAELVQLGALRRRPDGRVEALTAPSRLHSLSEEERDRRHRALAAAMPPGTPGRLAQWLLVGEAGGAIEEALLVSAQQRGAGRGAQAALLLLGTWARVRGHAREAEGVALLTELARAVISGTTAAQRAETEAALASAPYPALAPLRDLLACTRLAAEGRLAEAEAAARSMAGFADPELEVARYTVIARSLGERRDPAGDAFLASLANHPLPELRGRALGWLGLYRFEQGRFEDAARFHEQSGAAAATPADRARCLLNAGLSWLEVEPPRAIQIGRELEELAGGHRLLGQEMWAHHLVRTGTYRAGGDLGPDPELLAVSELLGEARRHAHLLLVEAAAAWRRGDPQARTLAETCAARCLAVGQGDFAVLAQALASCAGADAPPGLPTAVATVRYPRAQLQAAALLRLPRSSLSAAARDELTTISGSYRLDVLSRVEIEAGLT